MMPGKITFWIESLADEKHPIVINAMSMDGRFDVDFMMAADDGELCNLVDQLPHRKEYDLMEPERFMEVDLEERWISDQTDEMGRVELAGYWEVDIKSITVLTMGSAQTDHERHQETCLGVLDELGQCAECGWPASPTNEQTASRALGEGEG
jgi:hypothetical protein